ncbi:MAG: GNAT family N-acetyltransferase [Rubrivivax sp.]
MTSPPAASSPPLPITLRRAHAGDAEAFAQMMGESEVFAGLMQMPYADAAFWRTRLEDAAAAGKVDLHLVAERGGTLLGSAGLHPAGTSPRRRHAMYLGISVAKAHQGQGVGNALMTALCDYADRWAGVLRLELSVYADNQRAIALYQRHGFVVEGRHRAYGLRDGAYVDALAMARLHPRPPRWQDGEERVTG